nr:immunoglobulin heavy chain junction region [Mus musculus]
CAGTGGYW